MIPSKLEKARQQYPIHLANILWDIRAALEKAEMPKADIHDWRLTVEGSRIYSVADRYWIKAEVQAAGWDCVFKLRDADNENVVIYLS